MGSLEEIVWFDRDKLRDHLNGRYAEYDYSFDLWRVKGAFAQYESPYPGWKYYWAD